MPLPSFTAKLDIQFDSDNIDPKEKFLEVIVYPMQNRAKLRISDSDRKIEVSLDAFSHVLDFRPGYKK